MDVNAIWAPHALRSIALILETLTSSGIHGKTLGSIAPGIDSTALGQYIRNPELLRQAIATWRGARRHFEVTLGRGEAERHVNRKLASLPRAERRYWTKVVSERWPAPDSLFFLALSLDAEGRPIQVVNTDPATGLFLGEFIAANDAGAVARDLSTFGLPYPVGLFVDSVGPLVANDGYATPQIWQRFRADTYHSPRVVWGREVNLLLLGLARQRTPGMDTTLDSLLQQTSAAVEASGLGHNELWSYRIQGDHLLPVRYGASTDVQLWNTTDLAVEFVLRAR